MTWAGLNGLRPARSKTEPRSTKNGSRQLLARARAAGGRDRDRRRHRLPGCSPASSLAARRLPRARARARGRSTLARAHETRPPAPEKPAWRLRDRPRPRHGRERRGRDPSCRLGRVDPAGRRVPGAPRPLHGGLDDVLSGGFGRTLVSRPIRSSFGTVAPVLGTASLAFGLWYATAAWSLTPYPF